MADAVDDIIKGVALIFLSYLVPGSGAFATGVRTFLVATGVSTILGGIAAELMGTPKRPPSEARVNVTGGVVPQPIVFGIRRVGGQLVWIGAAGAANVDLHIAVAHSLAHPGGAADITDVYLDEHTIDDAEINGSGSVIAGDYSGLVVVRRHLGAYDQVADSVLDAAFTEIDSDFRGQGVVYTNVVLTRPDSDEQFRKLYPRGVPILSCLVDGMLCYDVRLDSENGGSGSHRVLREESETLEDWMIRVSATWGASSNPALIAATYLIMHTTDGGAGFAPDELDWDSFAAAANDNDESRQVPQAASPGYTTQLRYRFNGLVNTSEQVFQNLESICSAMLGTWCYTGNKIRVFSGVYHAPTATIDETWLRGPAVLIGDTPIDGIYNSVKGTFSNAESGYRDELAVPFTDASFEAEDGYQRLSREANFRGVTDKYQAQYMASVIGERSRFAKSWQLPLTLRGLDLEPFQTVTLDLTEINHSAVYRVVAIEITGEGVNVELAEENEAIYDDDLSLYTEVTTQGVLPLVPEVPPTPAGVTATGVDVGITLAWTALEAHRFSEYEIWQASSSGGTFTLIGHGRSNAYYVAVAAGVTRYFKIRARLRDQFSSYSSEVSATAKTVAEGATVGADWDSNVTDRPTDLTDGRVPTALNASGNLQSGTTAGALINGTAASTVETYSTEGHNLTVGTSGETLGDARNGLQFSTSAPGSALRKQSGSGSPLSAADVGSDVTITIAATYLYAGTRGTVSYASGTITGCGFSQLRACYLSDTTLAGGTPTYLSSTNSYAPAQADGNVYLGEVTTPADGGGGTGGEGGGGSDCVELDSWIDGVGYAWNAEVGTQVVTMSDGGAWSIEPITGVDQVVTAECVELETRTGGRVTCSAETPVPLFDGGWRFAHDALDHAVIVVGPLGRMFDQVVAVRPVGARQVVPIHVGGRSFPVSSSRDAPRIMLHNPYKP